MIFTLSTQNPGALLTLHNNRVFGATDASGNPLSEEARLAKIVQGILTYAPDQRWVMVLHYWPILLSQWPTGTVKGSSYSVMDRGYGQPTPPSQPGHSIELHFQAMDEDGTLGFVDFIDALIDTVNAATDTFLAGYISLRFTGGPTRAYLGMQQWNQTCSVEISVLQGVQGLHELLSELFRMGFDRGVCRTGARSLIWAFKATEAFILSMHGGARFMRRCQITLPLDLSRTGCHCAGT
jgi:hypothetical protein